MRGFLWAVLLVLMSSEVAEAELIRCTGTASSNLPDNLRHWLSRGIEADDCLVMKLEGEIADGSADQVRTFLRNNPFVLYADLDLLGGNVQQSLQISYQLRELGMMTFVDEADICASSCLLIWLGGIYRQSEGEQLRVHRFYMDDSIFREMTGQEIDRFYQQTTAALREFMSDMGVDADQDEIIKSMMTVPPEELQPVTRRTHPGLFELTDARDQWFRSNGCLEGDDLDATCAIGLVYRDRGLIDEAGRVVRGPQSDGN